MSVQVTYKTNGDRTTTARVVETATGKVLDVHSNKDVGRLYKLIRERYLSR
jgi:hypothetical protein